jgi:hypothetical protein
LKFLSDEYLECGIRTISMWGYLINLKIFMLILFSYFLGQFTIRWVNSFFMILLVM